MWRESCVKLVCFAFVVFLWTGGGCFRSAALSQLTTASERHHHNNESDINDAANDTLNLGREPGFVRSRNSSKDEDEYWTGNNDTFMDTVDTREAFEEDNDMLDQLVEGSRKSCYARSAHQLERSKLVPGSEEYLHREMFDCYNNNARPVKDTSVVTVIHVQVSLNTVEKLDMRTQKQVVRVVLDLRWTDENLSWDPAHYNNLTRITVSSSRIWLPDVTIESDTGSFEFIHINDIGKAVIAHTGEVTIWPSVFASLGTHLNISKYPFDTQIVTITFGSWSYHSEQVTYKLVTDKSPLTGYKDSSEWVMVSYVHVNGTYSFEEWKYERVGYQFIVRRRWLFYVMNVIGPVVLACLMNLLVFLLPAASGQRVTLAISICLSLIVFLSQIKDTMPKTSVGVSGLVVYLFLQIVGSVMTISVSVLVIFMDERAKASDQEPSSRVLSFLCRNVVPSSMMKTLQIHLDNASECTSFGDQVREEEVVKSPPTAGLGARFGIQRRSEVLRRNMLVVAAEHVNRICLWLSVIWNIVLLAAVLIFGHVA